MGELTTLFKGMPLGGYFAFCRVILFISLFKFGDILYLPATSSMCSLQLSVELSDLELKTTKFRRRKGIYLQDKYNCFGIVALGTSH